MREAAWPLIRVDFNLSYLQVGLLMTLPGVIADLVEPALGLMADTRRRRVILIGGGVAFTVSLFLTAASPVAGVLLSSWILFSPSSGAFVSVSQVALMDLQPRRRTQNMTRWSLAGSIGMTAGPLALGAAAATGFGWRGLYVLMGALTAVLVVVAWRSPINAPGGRAGNAGPLHSMLTGLRDALSALRRGSALRWLVLLELADLMLDVLFGFVALYFVDVAGVSAGQAAAAVVAWTVSGLIGDFLVIPLLERVPGLLYLRVSAAAAAVIFPAFLLAGPTSVKVVLLLLLGLVKAGWYSVLMARLYDAMPGRGGAAMASNSIAGLLGSLIPLGLGAVAQAAGLRAAMWLLMAAPLALLVGLPWRGGAPRGSPRGRIARRQARV